MHKTIKDLTDRQYKIIVSMVTGNPALYERLKVYFS